VTPRTLVGQSIRPSRKPGCFEQSLGLPELLVNQSKRPAFDLDLSAQLRSTPSAERSALRNLPLGSLEPLFGSLARLEQHTSLLLEKAAAHLVLFGGFPPLRFEEREPGD
jgi:hypothetical protein